MSSRRDTPRWRDVLTGLALLAASLALVGVYQDGQLGHTVRFLLELLVGGGRP